MITQAKWFVIIAEHSETLFFLIHLDQQFEKNF